LPQIARTPYLLASGSVNQTMRAEVVVPMQTFRSAGPSLRTPGAVCSRKAPEIHGAARRLVEDRSASVEDADDVPLDDEPRRRR